MLVVAVLFGDGDDLESALLLMRKTRTIFTNSWNSSELSSGGDGNRDDCVGGKTGAIYFTVALSTSLKKN